MMGGASRWALVAFAGSVALVLLTNGCQSRKTRGAASDQRLAAVASESLTTALADSIAPLNGFALAGEELESLSACDNRVDAAGWVTFTSRIIDLELPNTFKPSGGDYSDTWRSADASLTATATSPSGHGEHVGPAGTQCDVFIGGWPAHVELRTTDYVKGVTAIVQTPGESWISISGQAKTTFRQAQLLRAIRYARISSSWGRRY